MHEKLKCLIERYKESDIYESIKKYYVSHEINNEEYNIILEKIKKVLINYYLNKYKFRQYKNSENKNTLLISAINKYYKLIKKVKIKNDKIKIYPLCLSNEEEEIYYINIIGKMVEYEIETGLDFEKIYDIFIENIESSLKKYTEKLLQKEMEPYFGNPSYIIGRIKYIAECIKYIPNIDINVDDIIEKTKFFENKYFSSMEFVDEINGGFYDVNSQFYNDYDELEKYYKMIVEIENKLSPIVVEYWKQYLTDPNNHDNKYYRYIMHTFSKGMIDPNLITKACCSLNTDELIITPYGNCGLIYDLDVDSLDTFCTEDAGSWKCDKKQFIERGCPVGWQLPNPNGLNTWYEYEKNCKLIMPDVFEKECKARNVSHNGEILDNSKTSYYSEIYLNRNAHPIGVFYTDECINIDEVEAYAKKFNLPLINISLKTQRELKEMPALESYGKQQ